MLDIAGKLLRDQIFRTPEAKTVYTYTSTAPQELISNNFPHYSI